MACFCPLNKIDFGLAGFYCSDSALIHRHLHFSAFPVGDVLGE